MRGAPIDLDEFQARVRGLPWSTENTEREVDWLTGGRGMGVSRNEVGQVELFIVGPRIEPRLRDLARVMAHQEWHSADDSTFNANRLRFPASVELEPLVALCCLQLVRAGVESDPVAAFLQCEALLSVAVEQMAASSQELFGLLGELLVMRCFLEASTPVAFARIVEGWLGFQASARDYRYGGISVEVKATTQSVSRHHLHGISQLSKQLDEDHYWLVSVGLRAATPESTDTLTISSVVQSVVDILQSGLGAASAGPIQQLLVRIESYGSSKTPGYRHESMSQLPVFNVPLQIAFIRAYDMSDERLGLPLSEWFANAPWIDVQTLSVAVTLPRLADPSNPLDDLDQVARSILDRLR